MTRDERLALGYRRAAKLTRDYGTTYYWGALLLPPERRRHVYAVYGLCRLADDIVDEPDAELEGVPAEGTPAERLAAFRGLFEQALARGAAEEPVLDAVVGTVLDTGIDPECFDRFFDAMALDLSVDRWPSWERLRDGYMEGSAAVIGEMMLPVLEPLDPAATAHARSLGLAFQLTNFLRDVDEDLDRGRIYLPADELAAAGADPSLRAVTPEWRTFLAGQIARNRALYRDGELGLPMLPDASRRCVGTALVLYSRILDRIEAAGGDVFSGRIRVPLPEKLGMFAKARLLPEASARPEGRLAA